MKKHLFFAAFALSMMASCTSEDNLGVEQPTAPEDDRVAIQLGVDAPSVTATGRSVSRGTGSVGDVDDATNKWSGQRLYIAMVDEEGALATQVAQDGNGTTSDTDNDGNPDTENILDWTRLEYYAPSGENTTNSGDVAIYNVNTQTHQYEYYPVNGKYDFYGWHVDDAEGVTPDVKAGTATVTGITIDGTQDIMGARTKPFNSTNYPGQNGVGAWTAELADWAFSARTARAKVKPILKFEHQLARLKFYVRAGSENAALKDAQGNDRKHNDDDQTSKAMFVTALSVQNMVNIIDMNLNTTLADGTKGIETTMNENAETDAVFTLGSKITDEVNGEVGTIGDLEEVAPEKEYAESDPTTKGQLIGESIMFFPYEDSKTQLDLLLSLKQTVIDTESTADDGTIEYTYIAKERKDIPLKVFASSLSDELKEFKAGYSYNIYITVYGFERIEVTAELTNWKDGGDVDVDIEEGASKHDVDFTFQVTTSDNNTSITPTFSYKVNGDQLDDTDNVLTVQSYSTVEYIISAEGYEDATGYVNVRNGGNSTTIVLQKDETQAPAEQVTFTITSTPIDAIVTINDTKTNTVTVDKGTAINWSVEKNGYKTQTGKIDALGADQSQTITLVEVVKISAEAKDAENGDVLVGATVELKVDDEVVTSDIEIEVGTTVNWTVTATDNTVYTGSFEVTSGMSTVTLVCNEDSIQN